MAEKKEGFWSFLTRPIQNMSDYVTKGVTNLMGGRSRGDDNLKFGNIADYRGERFASDRAGVGDSISAPSVSNIQKTPTLNDIATGNIAGGVQTPDLTTPRDILGTGSTQEQDSIEIDEPVTLDQIAQSSEGLSAREIIEGAGVQNTVDVLTKEEKLKNEDWKGTIDSGLQSVVKFFTKTLNPFHWGNKVGEWGRKKAEYQSGEDVVSVGYNPENGNIMQLAINEGQGLFDDTGDTFWRRHKGNKETFDRLYGEYNNKLAALAYSSLDIDAKAKLANEAFQIFKKEVEDRELIKVYENDLYSDGLLAPIFMKDAKVEGRMKDKFTQDELDMLAKSNIKEGGIYKLSDGQFQAFLDSYDKNNELYRDVRASDDEDGQSLTAGLDDESKAKAMSAQQHKVLNGVTQQLTAQMEVGKITPAQRNEIENSIMRQVRERLDTMRLYLDGPLSFYTLVKQKNPGDLTDGERAILGYGPGIINLMEDYTDALTKWAEEAVRTGIDDEGRLATVPDTINGMSINDFLNNSIKDSNIQAGGVDLLSTESAIDAMQLINQNINHLYWKDKGSGLRRAWTEAGYWAGSYGYTAAELGQMGVNYIIGGGVANTLGIDLPARAKRGQDYHRADWLTASLAETDYDSHWYNLWSSDLGRLVKEYGLELTDIAGETAGMLLAEKPFLGATGSAARKSYQGLKAAQNGIKTAAEAQRKAGMLGTLYNNAKTAIGNTKIAGGVRRYLNSIIENVSPRAEANTRAVLELSKNGLRRIINDQIIDSTSTYLDTESFSTPSFWLSIGLTGITELMPALLKDTGLAKIIGNKLRGVGALDNTGWKMIDIMTSDDDVMKVFERYFGTNHPSFKALTTLAKNKGWSEFESALKQMYNQLNPETQLAMNKFSKQLLLDQFSRLVKLDWNSTYGKNLRAIIDANGTNISDMIKWIFGIPGKVDLGGFSSSILFKEGADLQTRYLTKNYDVALDNIDGGFRSKLQNGFTRADIEQIAGNTPYKSVIKDGKVNENLFELIEDGKYALNGEGVKALGLDVSEYTEAMAKADIIRKEAEGTKAFLDESLQKLTEGKGISKSTINKVVESGAFNRMINEFERIVC